MVKLNNTVIELFITKYKIKQTISVFSSLLVVFNLTVDIKKFDGQLMNVLNRFLKITYIF